MEKFAYLASHDLQEPLRKIITFSDRLKEISFTTDEKALDYLGRMVKAAERMKHYIDDLLEYSRAGRQLKHHERLSLMEICKQVLDDLSVQIKATNATINLGDLPVIEVDPVQFPRVFQNLLSNAIKYHKEDIAPIIHISSSYVKESNKWQIEVSDNGIGIEEKYFKRIFKPFERLHGRSAFEGTGIGLSICEKIIRLHNGTIDVRSSPGNGTTFIIKFPGK